MIAAAGEAEADGYAAEDHQRKDGKAKSNGGHFIEKLPALWAVDNYGLFLLKMHEYWKLIAFLLTPSSYIFLANLTRPDFGGVVYSLQTSVLPPGGSKKDAWSKQGQSVKLGAARDSATGDSNSHLGLSVVRFFGESLSSYVEVVKGISRIYSRSSKDGHGLSNKHAGSKRFVNESVVIHSYIVIVIFCIILLELQVSRKKLAYDAVPYEGILIRIMHSKSGRGKTWRWGIEGWGWQDGVAHCMHMMFDVCSSW